MNPQFQSRISQLADKKVNESARTNQNGSQYEPQKNKMIASKETELSKAGLVNVNQGVKEVLNYDKNVFQNQFKGAHMSKPVNESSTIKIPMSVIIESGILDSIKKAVKPKIFSPKTTQSSQPLDQDEAKHQMANEFKKIFS